MKKNSIWKTTIFQKKSNFKKCLDFKKYVQTFWKLQKILILKISQLENFHILKMFKFKIVQISKLFKRKNFQILKNVQN
jgi:hypothetical protein